MARIKKSALLALAALVTCTSVPVSAAGVCVEVEPVVSTRAGIERDDGLRFSATRILGLSLLAWFNGDLSGDHVLELEVYTPNGHLYQVLTAPVSTGPGGRGQRVRVPGYPDPLPVQGLAPVEGERGVFGPAELRLPVAGTSIITSSLYGTWTVKPVLDGEESSCGRAAVFTLEP